MQLVPVDCGALRYKLQLSTLQAFVHFAIKHLDTIILNGHVISTRLLYYLLYEAGQEIRCSFFLSFFLSPSTRTLSIPLYALFPLQHCDCAYY